ncbi:hypothetical protein, partial [Neisseria dentiae]
GGKDGQGEAGFHGSWLAVKRRMIITVYAYKNVIKMLGLDKSGRLKTGRAEMLRRLLSDGLLRF